jgi:organic hydroperoxide reductase OsmC/OhrA
MRWYLSLAGKAGIAVLDYVDNAEGIMEEAADGGGRFTQVVLRPQITLAAGSDRGLADGIHHAAHEKCFVAQSVNMPIKVEATYHES